MHKFIFRYTYTQILFFIFVILLLSINETIAQVFINEIVSSNEKTIADEDGDYEDWVEIFNSNDYEIDLSGMYLSDDDKKLNKWRFSRAVIPANGFIIIWTSGKDKVGHSGEIHTNFSIKAEGEELILTDYDGTNIDKVVIPALGKDVSYSRFPDGATWLINDLATPGQSNLYQEKLNPPIFSKEGGFYKENFQLSLASQNENSTILYTIDGSDPIIENVGGKVYEYKNKYKEFPLLGDGRLLKDSIFSYRYTESIKIENRTNQALNGAQLPTTYNFIIDYTPSKTTDVYKGIVVKSRIYKEGLGYSDIITQTYFVHPKGRDLFNLPIVSLSTSKENLFDYQKGIYVAGKDFDDWRKSFGLVTANPTVDANYQRRGDENEYAIQFEYFESNQEKSIINQTVGFRIHGGWSRAEAQKGLRLYARSDYGESKFEHQFFEDATENEFKRLILKNTSDFRIQDAICQQLIKHLNFESQSSQFVKVFLNGEYWGLHEMKERLDKHYLEAKYNIDPDNIDYLSNDIEISEGDDIQYKAMIDFVKKNSLESSNNYEVVKKQIDIENFTDYQIVQIYVNNKDWPHNNIDYWRLRTDSIIEDAPYGHDGKWRWMVYDLDMVLNGIPSEDSSSYNSLEWATRDHTSTVLLRNLLKNGEFSSQFINRFADLMNTTFIPERLIPIIEEDRLLYNEIFPEHILRWAYISGGLTRLNEIMNRMIRYVQTRQEPMKSHLKNKFNLKGSYNIELNTDDSSVPNFIKINTIELNETTVGVSSNPYPWTGTYYNGVPIEITAIPAPGYEFEYWEGMPNGTKANFVKNFEEDIQLIAHFKIIDSLHYDLVYISNEGGYLAGDTNQYVVLNNHGSSVIAKPFEGYEFNTWSDGRTDNPRVDSNIISNIHVEAIFEAIQYDLTYRSNEGGFIIGDSTQIVEYGNYGASVTAKPFEGYEFNTWSDGRTDNPRVDSNIISGIHVEAIFEVIQYDLTYLSNEGGYILEDSVQLISYGNHSSSVTAMPYNGYSFQSWSDGRIDNPRTDSTVISNINVEAIFSIVTSINQEISLDLKIYPNPVSQFLIIETDKKEAVYYKIIHSNGQLMKGEILNSYSTIDVSNLPPSIYILLVYDKMGNTVLQKFFKN